MLIFYVVLIFEKLLIYIINSMLEIVISKDVIYPVVPDIVIESSLLIK